MSSSLPPVPQSPEQRYVRAAKRGRGTGGRGGDLVQCSAVQCSAVQCSAVQCSAFQFSEVNPVTVLSYWHYVWTPGSWTSGDRSGHNLCWLLDPG